MLAQTVWTYHYVISALKHVSNMASNCQFSSYVMVKSK